MESFVVIFFVFCLLTIVATVSFFVWLGYSVVRGVLLLFGKGVRTISGKVSTRACEGFRCGQLNPNGAKFCRRCGRPIESAKMRKQWDRRVLAAFQQREMLENRPWVDPADESQTRTANQSTRHGGAPRCQSFGRKWNQA